jgi:hypothetical protein
MPQVRLRPMAVLTPVVIAGEEEGVGDVAAEAAGNMHEPDEPDDGGPGQGQPFTSDEVLAFRLDDFRLPLDDQPKGPAHGHHGQGFKRRIQGEAAHHESLEDGGCHES